MKNDTYSVQMVIDPYTFNMMLTEDDIKKHIKEKLAFELSKRILESNRTSFTYSNHHNADKITVKASIKL